MSSGTPDQAPQQYAVVRNLSDFDVRSGNLLERLVFNNRLILLWSLIVVSILLGWQASQLRINASFERMIPASHPYIKNFLDNRNYLRGLGNQLKVVVENTQGDIFDPEYLKVLAEVNDSLYHLPGVDRPWLKSLWTPLLRWTEVTEEGLQGGPVMPDGFDGSPAKIEELKRNIGRGGAVGSLVAPDYRSSMVLVPLLDRYADTGEAIDYRALSRDLEEKIRSKASDKTRIHIVGFGKLVGDLIEGLTAVFSFFGISAGIATLLVFLHTRCIRSTLVLVSAAVLGAIWLLGAMNLLGFELDPYSILVPFLVFAIGLSHGAQKMNGIMLDIGRGTHKYVAARYTFRRLFVAGLTAILTNMVGFLALIVIDIPVIRDMALMMTIGVTGLILTKLMLVPILLSYTGVAPRAAQRAVREDGADSAGGTPLGRLWRLLDRLTRRRWAVAATALAFLLTVTALVLRMGLSIGDLDAGAPELRPDSRYNRDSAYITEHYGLSSDVFAVLVKTQPNLCDEYESLVDADRLGWELRHLPMVKDVASFAEKLRHVAGGTYEGYFKWNTIPRDPAARHYASSRVLQDNPDSLDQSCTVFPVLAYLEDHKADTLSAVLKAVQDFASTHNRPEVQFLPAAGSAGIEAVTNIVVKESIYLMHAVLYGAVILLCYITFRSWRAVIIALIPLVITTLLCEALMVVLGIGVKVATLPVIALGVGIGVDYALYLLSVQLALQRRGASLAEAYHGALNFTGKIVALIGLTMAAAVFTWAWSPIKFQADMGILLTFMFLWNMIGALVLIPALSHFLLPGLGSRRNGPEEMQGPDDPASSCEEAPPGPFGGGRSRTAQMPTVVNER